MGLLYGNQKTLMQSKGVETPPREEKPGNEKIILPATIDRYADLTAKLADVERMIEDSIMPFDADIRELEKQKYQATSQLYMKRNTIVLGLKEMERWILTATEGQESCYLTGIDKGTMVKVKRSFMRKIDADGLWEAIDREGKLDHYGYLFKKSVTIKDFEGALKQPLFVKDAESFVERKVRLEKVEVM